MLGKHAELPTDRLVLVSNSGFSAPARKLAERKGAVPISPETLGGGDPEFVIANNLGSLWAKVHSMTPTDVSVIVEAPGDARRTITDPFVDLGVGDANGTTVTDLGRCVLGAVSSTPARCAQSDRMPDQATDLQTVVLAPGTGSASPDGTATGISPSSGIVPTYGRRIPYSAGDPAPRSAQSRGRHNRRSRRIAWSDWRAARWSAITPGSRVVTSAPSIRGASIAPTDAPAT
jgi:hypothetical protein